MSAGIRPLGVQHVSHRGGCIRLSAPRDPIKMSGRQPAGRGPDDPITPASDRIRHVMKVAVPLIVAFAVLPGAEAASHLAGRHVHLSRIGELPHRSDEFVYGHDVIDHPRRHARRGGGRFPFGISFTDNGNGTATLAGTPTGPVGSYALTLSATVQGAPSVTQKLTLTIAQAPAFTSPGSASIGVGKKLHFVVSASGSPTPTVSVVSGLPPWASATASAAGGALLLSGKAPIGAGGTDVLEVAASNGAGPAVVRDLTLGPGDHLGTARGLPGRRHRQTWPSRRRPCRPRPPSPSWANSRWV